ncbi:Hypothetical protein FKW44_014456, partial [Caligus rogercresseyi]
RHHESTIQPTNCGAWTVGLSSAEIEHLLHHWGITHGGYELKKRDSDEEKKPAVEAITPQTVEGSQAAASVELRNPLRPWDGVDRDVWTWRNEVIHSLSVTGGTERQKCCWVVELITGPVREPINHIINDVYMSNNPTVLGKPAVQIKDSVQLMDLIADVQKNIEHFETAERLHRAESRPHASSRTTRPPSSDVGAVGGAPDICPMHPKGKHRLRDCWLVLQDMGQQIPG